MPDGGGLYVERSPDFERIVSLPRRVFTREQAERDARELTPELVTPLGKKAGVSLRPLQGFVLRELWERRGVYASISVGAGKTLVSWLAPYVMNAQRAVLVVPDNLIEKTQHEFSEYRHHWMPDPKQRPPRLVGYKELTRITADALIARLQPDLWIFDEVDVLANQDGSATRRVATDICARDVPVLAMTGTDGRFSICDFSHFLTWALKENAPVPLDHDELERWASSLDEPRTGQYGRQTPLMPGALLELVPEDATTALLAAGWSAADVAETVPTLLRRDIARVKFQRRMAETPGVIMLDDDDCDQRLTIRHIAAPEDAQLNEDFELFKTEQTTPDGWDVTDPLSMWAIDAQLGCGMHYIVVDAQGKRPPEVWRDKRRAFARFVRLKIELSQGTGRPLYTELMVKKAYPNHPAITEWRDIEPTFTPISVPVWRSSSVVHAAAQWAKAHTGLIWVQHGAFGDTLSQVTGLPYYGAKGLTASGQSIVRVDGKKSAIVSFKSNLRGRNLQMFNRALFVGCPQSAKEFEQALGREHRYGQKNPVVADVMLTSGGSLYSFNMLVKEAKFVKAVRGKTQKVLRADIERTRFGSEALRWETKPVR